MNDEEASIFIFLSFVCSTISRLAFQLLSIGLATVYWLAFGTGGGAFVLRCCFLFPHVTSSLIDGVDGVIL